MIQKRDRASFRRLFSGTKLKWILDNIEGAREKQNKESYVSGPWTLG
jgi:glycerol kinase